VASHLLGPRSALPPYISVQAPQTEMGAGFLGAALNPLALAAILHRVTTASATSTSPLA